MSFNPFEKEPGQANTESIFNPFDESSPLPEPPGFFSRAASDIKNTVDNYFEGARKGFAEWTKEGNQLAESNPLALSGTPMQDGITNAPAPVQTPEQEQDLGLYQKSADTFLDESVKPVVEPAGLLGGWPLIAAAPFIGEDAVNSYEKGGMGQVARDFTYGGAVDFASQPDLAQKFHDRPVSTVAEGAMSLLPLALMGKGGYDAVKGYKKVKTAEPSNEGGVNPNAAEPNKVSSESTKGFNPFETGKPESDNAVTPGSKFNPFKSGKTETFNPFAGSAELAESIENIANQRTGKKYKVSVEEVRDNTAQNVLDTAGQFEGQPYVWGGSNPDTGFDCSGLVQYSYAQNGIDLPRLANEQYSFLKDQGKTFDDASQLKPGDLVFMNTHTSQEFDADNPAHVTHVGIYAGDGKVLQAGTHGIASVPLDAFDIVGYGRPIEGKAPANIEGPELETKEPEVVQPKETDETTDDTNSANNESSNADLLSQAHDAAEQGDYNTAAQLAAQAGNDNWYQTYKSMADKEADTTSQATDKDKTSDANQVEKPAAVDNAGPAQSIQDKTAQTGDNVQEPVPKEPWQMTQEEFNDNTVQRYEEPEVAERADINKPQGIYTTPGNVESPHADLGGNRYLWLKNPDANVLKVDTSEFTNTNRGYVPPSTGVAALNKFIGKDEVSSLMSKSRKNLANELSQKYPAVDWSKYTDQTEMLEGYAGMLAREKGYDAIFGEDNADPQFNEYVALTDKAMKPVNNHKQAIEQALAEGKSVAGNVLAEYPDLADKYAPELPPIDQTADPVIAKEPGPAGEAISPGAVSKSVNQSPLQQAAAETASRINQEIEPVSPNMGLSLRLTDKTPAPTQKGQPVAFADPEVEQRWQQAAKGVQPPSILSKAKEALETFKNRTTRDYEHLPHTAEFSPLREGLRQLQHQKDVAQELAGRFLQDITLKLDKKNYDLFTRKVVLDDLQHESGDLPFGLTKESLQQEKAKIDAAAAKDPAITEALAKRGKIWDSIKNDYIAAMKNIGFDVSDRVNREDYFRHQVLEYANAKSVMGTGKRLKTPANRGFLKQREGSGLDINANYLQAEHEVMAQMLHDTEVAKLIKSVDDNYNIRGKLSQQYGKDWPEHIPEGYTTWQPREGTSFYLTATIPEKFAKQLLDGAMAELNITPDQLGQALAKGAPFKEFVVKQEIADTLNKIGEPVTESIPGKISRSLITPWKVWTLTSPNRLIKYNLRNVSGDLDAVLTGNPKSLGKVHQAIADLYQVFNSNRAMPPEMFEWFKRGGMQSLLQVQELGDIGKLHLFKNLAKEDGKLTGLPKKAWETYWQTARKATDFRESILRYANYLDYLKQMKENDGRPKNFGASAPEEVMALPDIRDRAFKLSNELLGAYDSISVLGRDIRTHIAPFWSWQEINAKRYIQMFKNAAINDELAQTAARKVTGWAVLKVPYMTYKAGTFLVKASALWSLLQAYNYTRFPQEEKDLPPEEAARPHIILGRDKDGKVKYFTRLGAFSDFLEWFGLDTPAKDVSDYLNGKRTMREIMIDMVKSPANKVIQALSPLMKLPAELLTGSKTFPDAFNPRKIRDNPQYLADSLGLGGEFKALSETKLAKAVGMNPRPHTPYASTDTLEKLAYYKTDPGQAAYNYIQDEKQQYLKANGKGSYGGISSPKTDALRNYKLAVRYHDKEAATFYLKQYAALGGTRKGLDQSLKAMAPLAGLSAQETLDFVSHLNKQDRDQLNKSVKYYEAVLLGGKNGNRNNGN